MDILGGIGYREQGGMGESPITPTTLKHYCELVGMDLMKEEAVLILNLSKHYCSESAKYKDEANANIGAPFGFGIIQDYIEKHNLVLIEKKKKRDKRVAKKKKPETAEKDKKV